MPKIIVIGVGQLGSRHLQALKSVAIPLIIEVIDPSLEALQVAKERYDSLPGENVHTLSFHQTVQRSDSIVDIVIVATTAAGRRAAIEMCLSNMQIKYFVLEKLLFDRYEDYQLINEKLLTTGVQAWVNCCMRMMPLYQQLRNDFLGQAITYHVTGSHYGLVTNAIHYLDHMVYLTGCSEFTLDTSCLYTKPIASKRAGYLELNGTLLAHFKNGSLGILTCYDQGDAPLQIEISNQNQRVISREWQQKAWIARCGDQWNWQEIDARIPYQSEMTATLVKQILTIGECDLVSYSESQKIHLQLLNPLRTFLQNQNYQTNVDYPFT